VDAFSDINTERFSKWKMKQKALWKTWVYWI